MYKYRVFFFNSALAPQYLLNNYLFQVLVQKDEIKWYKKAKRVRIQVESDKKWLGLQTQTKTDFSFAWKIPWMEEPGRLQSMWPLRVRHDWATLLSLFTFMHWRRKWQLLHPLVSCLENPVDGGAWWAAVHRVTQSRSRLKRLSSSSSRVLGSLLNLMSLFLWWFCGCLSFD